MTNYYNSKSLSHDVMVDNSCDKHVSENIILNERYGLAKDSVKSGMRILNKHLLLSDTPVEGRFQLPKVLPYTGLIPETFIPYDAKVVCGSELNGVYCNIHDSKFSSTWTRPLGSLKKVRHYMVAVAPDHTLWVDGLICENIEQLRKARTTQRFWQNNGINTIQTASWGNAESVMDYAFDGLAMESWTAIGHQRIGNKAEQRLFKFAVKTLVERKRPIGLLVFGAPLDFDPGVPVVVKPSFISKLRKL